MVLTCAGDIMAATTLLFSVLNTLMLRSAVSLRANRGRERERESEGGGQYL